jgi:hypothetical protein
MTIFAEPLPVSEEQKQRCIAVANAARDDLNRRRAGNKLGALALAEFCQFDGTAYWQENPARVVYRHSNVKYTWTELGYFSWQRIDPGQPYPACLLTGETPIQKFCV